MSYRAVFAAAFLAFLVSPAAAEERITNYDSKIDVARNGALTVTETIYVVAEGERIRHGIFRDFPTTYSDSFGRKVHVGFNVLHVTRDGRDEPYDVENIEDGKRVKA